MPLPAVSCFLVPPSTLCLRAGLDPCYDPCSATRALGSPAGPRLIRTPGSPKESQDEGFSLPGLCPKLCLQPAADKSPNQVFALQSSSHSGNPGTILEAETKTKSQKVTLNMTMKPKLHYRVDVNFWTILVVVNNHKVLVSFSICITTPG